MKPLLLLLAMLLTACGHIEYQPLATIDHVDHSRGYRLQHVFHDQQDDDLFLVLLFSGGGTRAAAFGYGVLEVLAATPITGHGKTASLLEKTDLVHGVSGGSILATYLGLHGKNTVPRFEREFLQQNLQSTVLRQLLSLANLPRLTSAQYGRGDLLAEELDRLLYHGATFADLAERRQGPFAVISATDMSLGQRVEFTQEHFDALCLDLNRLPVARAVAASSAVPLIFAPITLNNHGGHCHYQPPPRARDDSETLTRYTAPYQDSAARPYIHLLDGGLTDNLGMRSLLDMADVYSSSMLMRRMTDHNIRRVVIISVNARNRINSDIDTKAAVPGFRNVLSSIVDIPIDRYSQESLRRLRAFADKWNEDNRNADDSKKIALSFVSLSLDDLPKSELRNDVLNIPTSFYLPPDDIAKLRTAAAILMKQSPEYKKLLEDLSAKPNKAAIYQETAVLPRTVSQSELDEINNPKAGADNGGNSDNDGK